MTHRLDKKTKGDKAYRKKEEEEKKMEISVTCRSRTKKRKRNRERKRLRKSIKKIFFFKERTYLSFLHFAHQNFPLWGGEKKRENRNESKSQD